LREALDRAHGRRRAGAGSALARRRACARFGFRGGSLEDSRAAPHERDLREAGPLPPTERSASERRVRVAVRLLLRVFGDPSQASERGARPKESEAFLAPKRAGVLSDSGHDANAHAHAHIYRHTSEERARVFACDRRAHHARARVGTAPVAARELRVGGAVGVARSLEPLNGSSLIEQVGFGEKMLKA
jgi:hypothetical protein